MPQPQRSSGSDHSRSHIGPSCGTCARRRPFWRHPLPGGRWGTRSGASRAAAAPPRHAGGRLAPWCTRRCGLCSGVPEPSSRRRLACSKVRSAPRCAAPPGQRSARRTWDSSRAWRSAPPCAERARQPAAGCHRVACSAALANQGPAKAANAPQPKPAYIGCAGAPGLRLSLLLQRTARKFRDASRGGAARTSCTRSSARMWSSVSSVGDSPPCKQKICAQPRPHHALPFPRRPDLCGGAPRSAARRRSARRPAPGAPGRGRARGRAPGSPRAR